MLLDVRCSFRAQGTCVLRSSYTAHLSRGYVCICVFFFWGGFGESIIEEKRVKRGIEKLGENGIGEGL